MRGRRLRPHFDLRPVVWLPKGYFDVPGGFVGPLPLRVFECDGRFLYASARVRESVPDRTPDGLWYSPLRVKTLHQVTNCGRDQIVGGDGVSVWQSRKTKNPTLHGLSSCGSPWVCSVCSEKIARLRREQILKAYEKAAESCAFPVMITFTTRHGLGDSFSDSENEPGLLSRLASAQRQMQDHRAYRKLARFSFGRVSALEVKWSPGSGWHPHYHQIWFFKGQIETEIVRSTLFQVWSAALSHVGLSCLEFGPGPRRAGEGLGVDVREAWSANDYITKFHKDRNWGPEREMTAHLRKNHSRGGLTPMQILDVVARGGSEMLSAAKAKALFRDYALATVGRSWIEFSRGLVKWLLENGVDCRVTEAQAAAMLEDDAVELGHLNDDEWFALMAKNASREFRKLDYVATFLLIVRGSGLDAGRDFIRGLPWFASPVRIHDPRISCSTL